LHTPVWLAQKVSQHHDHGSLTIASNNAAILKKQVDDLLRCASLDEEKLVPERPQEVGYGGLV
jgi:hypothetical protein